MALGRPSILQILHSTWNVIDIFTCIGRGLPLLHEELETFGVNEVATRLSHLGIAKTATVATVSVFDVWKIVEVRATVTGDLKDLRSG